LTRSYAFTRINIHFNQILQPAEYRRAPRRQPHTLILKTDTRSTFDHRGASRDEATPPHAWCYEELLRSTHKTNPLSTPIPISRLFFSSRTPSGRGRRQRVA
ncbi:unnamed protein product, partial [Ectocarpus sp. 8 AP-2014]